MRVREIAREAWRDVCAGAAWAVTSAVVVAVLLGSLLGFRAASAAGEVRAASAFLTSGAATTVQRAEGRIDGRGCDALADSEGVLASGALRRVDRGVVPAVLPGSTIPTYEVTSGMVGALGGAVAAGGAGLVLAPAVHDALGLDPGDELVTSAGRRLPVAGVYDYPDDGRDPDLEYAALAPAADDGTAFDACWVTVWPQRDDTVPMLRRTVLPSSGAEEEERPTVGLLNSRLGETFVWSAGLPDWVPASAAIGGGAAIGWAAVARRRLALASDRHVGVRRSEQMLGIVLQHLVWGVAGAAVAMATAVVAVRGLPPDDALPIVAASGVVAGLGLVGVLVGGGVGAASVRERALHRYFRSR